MKILIFNWRDIKNPKAGGAEIVTQEIAKRWVKWGNEVTIFTAAFNGSLPEEVVDGVRIIRRGGQVTTRFYAFWYYRAHFKGRVDVVIDEINTLPFFTPLFVREEKVVYFNQLAREVWFYETKFPLSVIGYLLEPLYLKLYRKTRAMVISESTKKDIQSLGVKDVLVFPMAIYFEEEQKYLVKKQKELTLIFVGRMVKSKRPEEAIKAAGELLADFPKLQVWMVGGGEENFVNNLIKLAKDLGVEKNVHFFGFVAQEKKFQLMGQAHLIVVTSIREGWGLIVTEANALKTPAIVYDVSGLRDAVKDKQTGLVVSPNYRELANSVNKIWKDQKLYQELQAQAYRWSEELTWEQTARESFKIITKGNSK